MATPSLLEPEVPTQRTLRRWVHKQLSLLEAERAADHEQSRLLTSNSPPKLLEANGLALLGLGVVSLTVGAGGNYQLELDRPSAFHASPAFPPHSIRTGDLVQIEDQSGTGQSGSEAAVSSSNKEPLQAVVSRIWDTRIVLSIKADRHIGARSSDGDGDLDIPTRCKVVKVANDVTYNRLDATMEKVADLLGVDLLEQQQPAVQSRASDQKHQEDPPPLKAPTPSDVATDVTESVAGDLATPLSKVTVGDEARVQPVSSDEAAAALSALSPEGSAGAPALAEGTAAEDTAAEDIASQPSQSSVTRGDLANPLHSQSVLPANDTSNRSFRRRPTPTPLLRSFFGLEPPQWNAATSAEMQLPHPLFNKNLNETQIAAIDFCMRAQHFALLHGPPGTGKTTTLAELVLQTISGPRKRVLVAAASNLAVDNLAEKILRGWEADGSKVKLSLTRIGHPARVFSSLASNTLDEQSHRSDEGQLLRDVSRDMDGLMATLNGPDGAAPGNKSTRGRARTGRGRLRGAARRAGWEELRALRKEFRNRERGVTTSILSRADVVLSTCHGAGGRVLDEIEFRQGGFDLVVIDEACQALEAACWIPILRAKRDGGKVILAGDHLQLPPTVKGVTRMDLLQRKGAKERTTKEPKDRGKTAQATEDGTQDVAAECNGADSAGEGMQGTDDVTTDGKSESRESEGEEDLAGLDEGTAEGEKAVTSRQRRHPTLRPPRTLETTLFSRLLGLYGAGCKALLSVQYRMNDEIMAFANAELYEGKLQAHESCKNGRLESHDDEAAADDDDDDGLMSPLVFYDTSGCDMFESNPGGGATLMSESKRNQNEAVIVQRHVSTLLERGVRPEDIGVIAPYAAQASLLSDTVRPLGAIEVSTVDGFQGREKEAIVISLTRSNPDRTVGFLAEHRRLNVAMTRPKKHLAVVGDARTVGAEGGYLKRWMDHLEQEAVVEFPE